jgi:alkanesulfonate monooxygenase SsuD/methylene tetrahydromethanopterin reductase-like flavin-dependent oxidoreductase (luciferase family)
MSPAMGERGVELAVALPSASPGEPGHIGRAARLAESLDFDSAWVGDHLAFPPPMIEAVVALSVAAGATERIGLGFGVLQAGLRHPVLLAKMLGSLAAESRGRLSIGLGVGGTAGGEWRAVGADTRQRGALLDELLEVLPPLLAGQRVDRQGPRHAFTAGPMLPVPERMPPIWVGGTSTPALARAARHDGWLGFLCTPDKFARKVAQLADLAKAAGRRPPRSGIALIAGLGGSDREAHQRCADYLRAAYGLDAVVAERWAVGGASQIRDLAAAYAAAGASLVQVYAVDEPEDAWPVLRDAVP